MDNEDSSPMSTDDYTEDQKAAETANTCYELVETDQHAESLVLLFTSAAGSWHDLSTLLPSGSIDPLEVFVTWLQQPPDDPMDYRLVLFLERALGTSRVAHYNYARFASKMHLTQ